MTAVVVNVTRVVQLLTAPRVRAFLDQFAGGSQRLLEYVGLLGNGQVAQMVHGP